MRLHIETVERDGSSLREVVLRRGRGNSLEEGFLREIEAVFGDAPARPTVLRSAEPSFCTGLDLDLSLGLDRDGMRRQMEAFHDALAAVFDYAAPVVAAIEGHALAGGALLALAADARVMARGAARFGIHGVQLGVVYPDVAIEIVRHQLGRRRAERALYGGRPLTDAEALDAGWVDRLEDAEAVRPRAHEIALELVGPDPRSFAVHKRSLRRSVARRLRGDRSDDLEPWLDHWFAPETRARITAARRERKS